MSDSDITTVTLPPGSILVTPKTLPEYIYERVGNQDVLAIQLDDKRVGSILVALTPSAAQHAIAHLQAMLDDLPALRAEWNNRNREQGGTTI